MTQTCIPSLPASHQESPRLALEACILKQILREEAQSNKVVRSLSNIGLRHVGMLVGEAKLGDLGSINGVAVVVEKFFVQIRSKRSIRDSLRLIKRLEK